MSTNEIVPANNTTDAQAAHALSLSDQWKFAETVASSSIVPKAYRGDPGAVLVAVNLGQSMQLSPAEALYRLHVIEGKPTASGELIASNVRKAGHKLRILHSDTERCTVEITRADDPEHPHAETWTIQEARGAELAHKDNWRKYPADMLFNRAVARCARRMCSEALYGVIYTEDEVRESVTVTQEGPAPRESAADVLTPQPEAEPAPDMVTSSQMKKIGAGMRDLGMTDRDLALEYVSDTIGRKITSRNELTKDEARKVIDDLEGKAQVEPAGDPELPEDNFTGDSDG